MTENKWSAQNGWIGDLGDDCYLHRYGMFAHVEKMDRNVWWFCVGVENPHKPPPFYRVLYNSADRASNGNLTSGAQARRAAEEVMECLRIHNINHWLETP